MIEGGVENVESRIGKPDAKRPARVE